MTRDPKLYLQYLRETGQADKVDLYKQYLKETGQADPEGAGVVGNFARGVGAGTAQGGASLLGAAGYIGGALMPGISRDNKLTQFAKQSAQDSQEFFDPRGTAGKIGQFIGRGGYEVAGAAAGGVAGLAGLAKAAPKVLRGKFGKVNFMEGVSRKKKFAALTGAMLPVDIVQGIGAEEGMVLPGRTGATLENIAFSGLGSAIATRPRKPKPVSDGHGVASPQQASQAPDVPAAQEAAESLPRFPEGVTVGGTTRRRPASSWPPPPEQGPLPIQGPRTADGALDTPSARLDAALNTPQGADELVVPGTAKAKKKKRSGNRKGFADFSGPVNPSFKNRSGVPKQVWAQHNITEQSLERALNADGKLIAPSIAVQPVSHNIGKFGKVNLVGREHLFDPKSTFIGDADLYSATVPDPDARFTPITLDEVQKRVADGIAGKSISTDWTPPSAPKVAGKGTSLSQSIALGRLGPDVIERAVKMHEEGWANNAKHFLADELAKGINMADGDLLHTAETVGDWRARQSYLLAHDLLAENREVGLEIGGKLAPWTPENAVKKMFPEGEDIRGQQFPDDDIGWGTLRARIAKQFETLDEIKDYATRKVRWTPEVEAYEAKTVDELTNWVATANAKSIDPDMPDLADVDPDFPSAGLFGQKPLPADAQPTNWSGTWGNDGAGIDAVWRKYVRGGGGDKGKMEWLLEEMLDNQRVLPESMTPDELKAWLRKGAMIARRFRSGPVDYLEGKPTRVVSLDEMAGAVVPPSGGHYSTDPKLIEGLKDYGIEVVERLMPQTSGLNASQAHKLVANNTNPYRQLSLERLRAQLEAKGIRTAGFTTQQMMEAITGAGLGGLTGYAAGDDEDQRPLNAALGVLGGATGARGLGAGVRAAARGGGAFDAASDAMEDIAKRFRPGLSTRLPTDYERALVAGKAGVEKPITTQSPLMNPSLRITDPKGKRLMELEVDRLMKAGHRRHRVSDKELREWAKRVDIDELVAEDALKLDSAELEALGTRISEDRDAYQAAMEVYEKATPEARLKMESDMDAALDRLASYDKLLNRAGSEQGRGLRVLSKLAAKSGTFESALHAARKTLNVKDLPDEVLDQLSAIMKDPSLAGPKRAKALQKKIADLQAQPWHQVVIDVGRWSLLSAPATWMVNLLGTGAEGAARNVLVTPVASTLDRIYSAATGQARTTTTRGRGKFFKGFREGGQNVKDDWEGIRTGIDPDDPTELVQAARVNYVRSLGLDAKPDDGLARTGARKTMEFLQESGNAIYGILAAGDRPFVMAAEAAALSERSGLRALREGFEPGTKEFAARTAELMQPENIDIVDAIMARAEALDATFKTPTKVGNLVRQIPGGVGQWFVPFANTPTNLVRQALEGMPGIGQAITYGQTRAIRKKLTKAGASPEAIAREVRRKWMMNTGKQMSTSAGSMATGYVLTKLGLLTGEYTPPMGRTDDEREDANRQRLFSQGPLTIRVGNRAYGLSAFANYAPLLAFGHSLAKEDDRRQQEGDGFSINKFASRGVATAAATVAEMPLLQGLENATKTLRGEFGGGIEGMLGREAATAIPFSSGVAATARAIDPVGRRAPETFTEQIKERLPFLRETVAPRVGPFGEVQEAVHPLESLFSPLRQTRVNEGPLYDALDEMKLYPTNAPRGKFEYLGKDARRRDQFADVEETQQEYAARRQEEGAVEKQLLEDLLSRNPKAWRYVSPSARRDFNRTQDWKALLSSALARQRSAVTRQRKQQVTQAQR